MIILLLYGRMLNVCLCLSEANRLDGPGLASCVPQIGGGGARLGKTCSIEVGGEEGVPGV